MEGVSVCLDIGHLRALLWMIPCQLRIVCQAKCNAHFINKLLPHYGRVHAGAVKSVGCIASQVHDSMGSLQVAWHMGSHVLKVKNHLVQPCINIDAIYCPIKGL